MPLSRNGLLALSPVQQKNPDEKAATPNEITIPITELTLHEELGAGTFGRVLKAQYLTTLVAVKFYAPKANPEPAKSRMQRELQFSRETTVLNQITKEGFANHPNLLESYGRGAVQQVEQFTGMQQMMGTCYPIPVIFQTLNYSYYLVLEYMQGGSLERRLTKGPLGWKEFLNVATHVAAGVVDLHAMGFIHRDIKPGNIFLGSSDDRFDKVKLGDFGTAIKEQDSKIEFTGTPFWMAPEIMKSRALKSADVYSFGVTLLQMLSPSHFTQTEKDIPVLMWVSNIPQSISRLAKSILDTLNCAGATPEEQKDFADNIIRKCIAIDPKQRPTMKAVLDDLRLFQNRYLQRVAIATKAIPDAKQQPSALAVNSHFKHKRPPAIIIQNPNTVKPRAFTW